MSLELDWLEREERYRQRVTRLLTVFVIVVGALVGTGAYLRSKHSKEAREAAARAAEQQRLDAERRQREQFTADSSAVADRYAGFIQAYQAEPLEGLPFLAIPLPAGQPARPYVERLWTEYVRVIDPAATSSQEIAWYRQNFIGVLNDGPLRGRAVLLPVLDQRGTTLEIHKTSFTQITKGQVEVGMREPIPEAVADSLGLVPGGEAAPPGGETAPPATDASSTPPATTAPTEPAPSAPAPETAPAPPAPAPAAPTEPAPAPAPTEPAPTEPAPAPAPTEPAPTEPAPSPAPTEPAPSAPADTSTPAPAPADTVPKP